MDDVIQEAMARGEFDNLTLAGKPLPERNINPYVDTTTQKINEVGVGSIIRNNSSSGNTHTTTAKNVNRQQSHLYYCTCFTQHLINNGFAPEWVMVEKEVRQQRESVRQRLRQARQRLGTLPLTPEEEVGWQDKGETLCIFRQTRNNITIFT